MSHAKERTVNQESVDIWAKSFVEIKTIQAEGKNLETIMNIFGEEALRNYKNYNINEKLGKRFIR